MKAYDKDLAYIHDTGHGDFAGNSAPGLLQILHSCNINSGLVVDLGCGSGIWAASLLEAGYRVLGVDISEPMLEIARQRAPSAEFRCQSFLNTQIPACDAITSIGECLGYLFDEANSYGALLTLFTQIHKSLSPGGLLIFDFLEPGIVKGSQQVQRFREGTDWAVLVELSENHATNRLTRRITSFRSKGSDNSHYHRDYEEHNVQLLNSSLLAKDLREIGFRVRRLRGYGEYRFRPGHIGLVARKI